MQKTYSRKLFQKPHVIFKINIHEYKIIIIFVF